MGNEQEELEVWVQLQDYNLIDINHGGRAQKSGMLRWMDAGTSSMWASWEVKEELNFMWDQWECTELCLGVDDEPSESLWIRVRRQTNEGGTAVGVC